MKTTNSLVFLLVHGTWAKGAPWTQPGSRLHRHLQDRFPESKIERIDWSGANQFVARQDAAKVIESRMGEVIGGDTNAKVILIGHSHGGSAINYAVRNSGMLRNIVSGIAYMSTPFMTFVVRPGYHQLYQALLTAVFLVLWLAGLFAFGLFGYDGGDLVKSTAILMGVGMLYSLALALLFRFLLGKYRVWLGEIAVLEPAVKDLDTMMQTSIPSRFYRSTGDEVALALGTLQLISTVSSFIGRFIANLVSIVVTHALRLWSTVLGRMVVLILATAIIALGVSAGALANQFGTSCCSVFGVFNPFSDSVQINVAGSFAELIVPPTVFVARLLMVSIGAISGLAVLATVLYSILNVITLRVFGVWSVSKAFYFECAAEPMPFGLNTFLHSTWNEEDPSMAKKLFSLHHSEPYSSQETLDDLEAWVRSLVQA